MTQAALAAAVGASRKWVSEMEAGKSTTEIGRVFAAMIALDIILSYQKGMETSPGPSKRDIPDVGDVLAAYGRRQ